MEENPAKLFYKSLQFNIERQQLRLNFVEIYSNVDILNRKFIKSIKQKSNRLEHAYNTTRNTVLEISPKSLNSKENLLVTNKEEFVDPSFNLKSLFDSLIDDLLYSILTQIPVINLLNLMRVCKKWKYLIELFLHSKEGVEQYIHQITIEGLKMKSYQSQLESGRKELLEAMWTTQIREVRLK